MLLLLFFFLFLASMVMEALGFSAAVITGLLNLEISRSRAWGVRFAGVDHDSARANMDGGIFWLLSLQVRCAVLLPAAC